MSSSTRVPYAELDGIAGATMKWMSKKRLDEVPSPLDVYWHNRPVLKSYSACGLGASRSRPPGWR